MKVYEYNISRNEKIVHKVLNFKRISPKYRFLFKNGERLYLWSVNEHFIISFAGIFSLKELTPKQISFLQSRNNIYIEKERQRHEQLMRLFQTINSNN